MYIGLHVPQLEKQSKILVVKASLNTSSVDTLYFPIAETFPGFNFRTAVRFLILNPGSIPIRAHLPVSSIINFLNEVFSYQTWFVGIGTRHLVPSDKVRYTRAVFEHITIEFSYGIIQ